MKKYLILFLLLALHLAILVNLQFTAWPEMFSFPYLLQHGYQLYDDMVFVYTPLLPYFLFLFFSLFGYKLIILKLLTWVLIISNDLLIFLVIKKITKKISPALVGVFAYVLLQPMLEGNMLWFDLAYVTPLLLSKYLLLNKKYFYSGLGLSAAILTKQIAVLFVPIFVTYLILSKTKNIIYKFLFGLVIPIAMFGLILYLNKQLVWFTNWTFYYPMKYWSDFPSYIQLVLSKREFLILALLVIAIFTGTFLVEKTKKYFLLLGFLVASFVAVYPRFSFFHLQAFIALFAIWIGFAYSKLGRNYLLVVGGVVLCVVWLAPRNFSKHTRFWDQDSFALAQKLPQDSSAYFLNLPSQHYVLTNSLPPKPWVDNYGWYWEIPDFQQKLLKRWGQNMPEYIVRKDIEAGEWYELGTYEPQAVTDWIESNYNMVEEVEKGIWLWQKKD